MQGGVLGPRLPIQGLRTPEKWPAEGAWPGGQTPDAGHGHLGHVCPHAHKTIRSSAFLAGPHPPLICEPVPESLHLASCMPVTPPREPLSSQGSARAQAVLSQLRQGRAEPGTDPLLRKSRLPSGGSTAASLLTAPLPSGAGGAVAPGAPALTLPIPSMPPWLGCGIPAEPQRLGVQTCWQGHLAGNGCSTGRQQRWVYKGAGCTDHHCSSKFQEGTRG